MPIKLHIEFDQITVGELSNYLRQWQALLRVAWRESYELHSSDRVPNSHILVVSASTENSFEIIACVAIAANLFGPAMSWPDVAKRTFRYLHSVWSDKEKRFPEESSNHTYIRGGESPEIRVSDDILRDSDAGDRVVTMWRIANGSNVRLRIEESTDDDESEQEE